VGSLVGSTPIITGMGAPFSRRTRTPGRAGRLGASSPLLSHSRSGAGTPHNRSRANPRVAVGVVERPAGAPWNPTAAAPGLYPPFNKSVGHTPGPGRSSPRPSCGSRGRWRRCQSAWPSPCWRRSGRPAAAWCGVYREDLGMRRPNLWPLPCEGSAGYTRPLISPRVAPHRCSSGSLAAPSEVFLHVASQGRASGKFLASLPG
jgi:hypothetical protein